MNTTPNSQHGTIFASLVVLAFCGVGAFFLHLPVMMNNLAIFAIALLMALLVFFQYMDLKSEGKLIYWVIIIPFILFGILVALFTPDVCHFNIDWLKNLE